MWEPRFPILGPGGFLHQSLDKYESDYNTGRNGTMPETSYGAKWKARQEVPDKGKGREKRAAYSHSYFRLTGGYLALIAFCSSVKL